MINLGFPRTTLHELYFTISSKIHQNYGGLNQNIADLNRNDAGLDLDQNYIETSFIYCPSKLRQIDYVEMTSTFCPSKLCWIKDVETTSIFHPSTLYWKSMSKWRGMLWYFVFWRINAISTSSGRRFDVLCPLGGITCNKISF